MDNKPSICRICVEQNEGIQLISDVRIEYDNVFLSLVDVLGTLVGFEVLFFSRKNVYNYNYYFQITSCSPHYICPRCIENATSSYKFKILCDTSNKKYFKYLEIFKSKEVGVLVEGKDHEIKEEKQLSDDDLPLSFLTNENSQSDMDIKNKEVSDNDLSNRNIDTKPEMTSERNKKRKLKNENNEIWENQLGSCKFCTKLFKNKYVLIAHEKRHENKGKFICNECGKGFDSKGCLSRHIKVHTGEKEFQCEVCRRCFSSSNNLRLHSRRHNGIKVIGCFFLSTE